MTGKPRGTTIAGMRTALLLAWSALLALTSCSDDTGGSGGGDRADDTAASDSSAEASSSGETATSSSTAASASSASSTSTGEPEVCPWFGEDPGTLAATGAAVGDVIENVSGLIDQCGVTRSLWDFAGGYRILSITTGW